MATDRDVLRYCRESAWRVAAGQDGWERTVADDARTLFDDDVTFHLVNFARFPGDVRLTRWVEPSAAAQGGERHVDVEQWHRHPGIGVLLKPATRTIRLSDLVDLPRFRDTRIFLTVHGHPPGTRFAAAARLRLDGDRLVLLGAHGVRRDFGADEMQVLGVVQRVLSAALALQAALTATGADEGDAGVPEPHAADGPAVIDDRYWPTPREQQVLALVVRGWTSRQIARRLEITERTVRKHLDGVYSKAGVPGRAAAAAWWERTNGDEPAKAVGSAPYADLTSGRASLL